MATTIFLSVFCTLSLVIAGVVIAFLIRISRVLSENNVVINEANQVLSALYQQQEHAMMAMGREIDEDEDEDRTPIGLMGE